MSLLDPASVPRLVEGSPRAPGIFGSPHNLARVRDPALNPFCGRPLLVEFLRPGRLTAIERARWARLSEAAAPGNIFAQEWFMAPALRYCGTQWSLRLAVVRQASGAWLGVLPLTLERRTAGRPAPSFQGWYAANQFIGTPLVRAGAERVFWQTLLARLDARPGAALGLYCGALPMTDPVTLALASLCAEQGRKLHLAGQISRPARLPGGTADPIAVHKLDRRLDALEARLAQALGPVNLVLHDLREDCDPWLAAYFALERAGSRSRAESALACCPTSSGLFREVIRHGHRRGTARLASLTAGERIVAMASWFVADGHGYGYKMTFDEAYRGAAPSRLLMRRVVRTLANEAPLLFDSCANPDTASDPLWPKRRALSGLAIGIGGAPRRALFDMLMRSKDA